MGDSDLEFYSREAFKRGEAEGYARAQADIVRMLRDDFDSLVVMQTSDAREVEDRNLIAHCVDEYIKVIEAGGHVGRAGK